MELSYYKSMEPFWGSWRIIRLLGEGSFGKVFEIEREDFGRTYKAALKVITIPQTQSEIKSVLSDGMDLESATSYYKSFVEEVIDEFALMSGLKGNSNIVSYEDHTVIEHKESIGWDILIRMELLTPLLDYASAERPMGRDDIIRLGIDICKALECCQKQNIIHRDIKPENIFVSSNGDFKLGDFGIARTVEKTTSGLSRKGTYTYMAPEVYKGQQYGSSVDIYSLGIVLYRLVNNNRAPFLPDYPAQITHSDRENSVARRVRGERLPVPVMADQALADVVLKACAYLPQDRYATPEAMREDLEALLTGRPQPFQQLQQTQMSQQSQPSQTSRQPQQPQQAQMSRQPQQPEPAQPSQPPRQPQASIQVDPKADYVPERTAQNPALQGQMDWEEPPMAQSGWEQSVQPQTMSEEENTVFLFENTNSGRTAIEGQQNQPQPPQQEEAVSDAAAKKEKKNRKKKKEKKQKNEKKKKSLGKKIALVIGGIVAAVLLVFLILVIISAVMDKREAARRRMEHEQLASFAGQTNGVSETIDLSNEIFFGGYVVNERPSSTYSDTNPLEFLDGMAFTEIDGEEVSILPFEIYCFKDGDLDKTGLTQDTPLADVVNQYDIYGHIRNKELGVERAELFKQIAVALLGDQAAGQAEEFYRANIQDKMDFAKVTFIDQRQHLKTFYGYYKAEGSVMDFGYLKLDEQGNLILEMMQFTVKASGRNLEFSKDGISRTLMPWSFAPDSPRSPFLTDTMYGFANSKEDVYKEIVNISIFDMLSEEPRLYIDFADGDIAANPVMQLSDEGHTITLSWDGKAESKGIDGTYKGVIGEPDSITFQYFTCGGSMGFVLRADGRNYLYQRTRDEYYADILEDSLQDVKAADLEEMSDEDLKEVAVVQQSILDAMRTAYADAGIEVEIDEQSGKITMSDNILFGLDSAELSEEGKAYLDGFLKVYADVILDESSAYHNYINAILLEGHTDSSGDYAYNQQLSEARAEAVDDYCYDLYPALSDYIDTVGCASDDLVYDENGEENREASRRVVFRVLLDLEAF